MAITESTIDVNESTTSVSACVNITNGYLESTNAYAYYSINSGSAMGKKIYLYQILFILSWDAIELHKLTDIPALY